MVILNLSMNNIYSFKKFNVNFSYPKKLTNSLIENENLEDYKSFRYKKLNIFIGANATGKTSLIKVIWRFINFISVKEKAFFLDLIDKSEDSAYLNVDFVENNLLYRIKIRGKRVIVNDKVDYDITIAYNSLSLKANSSYENRVDELDSFEYEYNSYLDVLNKLNFNFGFRTALPATENGFEKINFIKVPEEYEKEYINTLYSVLNTLDPAITAVYKSNDSNDAYVVVHESNRRIILQEGNSLSSIPFLSSGTKYGISIANIMFSIKNHLNGIYLIDEQFSYVNADVEAAILSTMVSNLGPNEQIFFTTHNSSVLSMSFPMHSLYFMKKKVVDGKSTISIDCASNYENRNNVSAKNLFDNDVFQTAPKLNNIYKLGK